MNHFHHYAVVFVFLTACHYIAHGHVGRLNLRKYHVETLGEILDNYDPSTYDIVYVSNYGGLYRKKRGFFSMKIPSLFGGESVDDGKEVMADTTTTSNADTTTYTVAADMASTAANVEAIYNGLLNTAQSQSTHILSIGTDVKRTLVEVAPYLPLVNKVSKHIVPDLSEADILTLSVNVAALTTQGIRNYSNAEPPNKSNSGGSISQYATGIYHKLKDAFKSHFGDDVPDNYPDKENTNSLEENRSIFDTVKSKMSIFSSFMNGFDAPKTEKNENQVETIVTHTYIDGSQTPTTDTTVTKNYEKSTESIHKITDGETKYVLLPNKLLKDGKQRVYNVITEMKNEFNTIENSSNESNLFDDDDDLELYNDDNVDGSDSTNSSQHSGDDENTSNDDDDENDNVEVHEEDFKQVLQESMTIQPEFVQTLDGEELLEKIDEFQKLLPNPNTNNRKIFEALIEELDIDERVDDDVKVNELINGLEKTTNYFISSGIKRNELLTIPPTLPPN
ncbi:NAD-dependent protein deacetylase HST1-like [Aphis craccivora]|uniref:NAD-dependent protein deacetylase HST1-like n=1 Tax=Aphis craccivora TaxID=307492 RepID=A0A6G0ZBV6_APHCR|nr:NAD-dependent protein deacetylase HST1-like [Aphis craccivora]